ncbi:MAG: serine/threonine protein phosphatase [Verrucomicrobiota bacterium]
MKQVKDTKRAEVHINYDGRVIKWFKGTQARERFENERCVLNYLENVGCPNVPRLLEVDESQLKIVTTNCGPSVESLSSHKLQHLFQCLESYGVRHGDQAKRNVTYDRLSGQFCIIDFEYATILSNPNHQSPKPFPDLNPIGD